MNTVVGRHVIIHWNPNERTLCGGTLEFLDASLEIVAGTYGVSLPAKPAIEIYWELDGSLASGLCTNPAVGCSVPFPNGANFIVVYDVTNLHELTHAVRLTGDHHGMPAFFGEGVAVRWERGPGQPLWWRPAQFGDPNYRAAIEDNLRELLAQRGLGGSAYSYVGFFWTWLEAEYGGPRMAQFAAGLGRFSAPSEIDRVFFQTFGVTLTSAIDAFRDQPPLVFDVHACAMDHLPRLTWAEQPLRLSGGPDRCDSAELVNVAWPIEAIEDGAVRLAHLQLPDTPQQYVVTTTGPESGYVFIEPCVGHARPHQDPIVLTPANGPTTLSLAGNHVVSLLAPLERDGTVNFVDLRLEAP